MALNTRSLKMRILLKERIRKKNYSYGVIAKKLGVSLPTIKRWMTKDDFPFESLDALLNLLDLSWSELTEKMNETHVRRELISEKQELFISKNPQIAYVFLMFFRGLSFDEVRTDLKIAAAELEKMCFQLDRANLIVFKSPKSVRPLVRGPFKWKSNGAFSKKYFQQCARLIFQIVMDRNSGFARDVPTRDPWMYLGETYMSKKSFAEMKVEFWKLQERFNEIAQRDQKFLKFEDLIPVTQMHFFMELNLWRFVQWESKMG